MEIFYQLIRVGDVLMQRQEKKENSLKRKLKSNFRCVTLCRKELEETIYSKYTIITKSTIITVGPQPTLMISLMYYILSREFNKDIYCPLMWYTETNKLI